MTDPVARQQAVESQLGWVRHHAQQADLIQGDAPVHLSYWDRQDLAETIQRLQRMLDAAEDNYRREYAA